MNNALTLKLSTHHKWNIRLRNENSTSYPSQFTPDENIICETKEVSLGEFGVYDIKASEQCKLITQVEPVNEYMAILVCTLILVALCLCYKLGMWAVKKRYTGKLEKLYKLGKSKLGYNVS